MVQVHMNFTVWCLRASNRDNTRLTWVQRNQTNAMKSLNNLGGIQPAPRSCQLAGVRQVADNAVDNKPVRVQPLAISPSQPTGTWSLGRHLDTVHWSIGDQCGTNNLTIIMRGCALHKLSQRVCLHVMKSCLNMQLAFSTRMQQHRTHACMHAHASAQPVLGSEQHIAC